MPSRVFTLQESNESTVKFFNMKDIYHDAAKLTLVKNMMSVHKICAHELEDIKQENAVKRAKLDLKKETAAAKERKTLT